MKTPPKFRPARFIAQLERRVDPRSLSSFHRALRTYVTLAHTHRDVGVQNGPLSDVNRAMSQAAIDMSEICPSLTPAMMGRIRQNAGAICRSIARTNPSAPPAEAKAA